MSRCVNCGTGCNCAVGAADSSVVVTPTAAGYTIGTVLAPSQPSGQGGAQMLRKVTGGLFLGAEQVAAPAGGGGGAGGISLLTQKPDGTVDTSQVTALRVAADGFGNVLDAAGEPRYRLQGDGTKVLIIPGQAALSGGQVQQPANSLHVPGNWNATLPRGASGVFSTTLDSVGGQVLVVPAGQVRRIGVVLTIEIGQRNPDPVSIAYAAKIGNWYTEFAVSLTFGSAAVTFVGDRLRWEQQPMCRNMKSVTFSGAATVPAGSYAPRLKLDLITDALPTAPNVIAGIAGWNVLVIA